MAKTKKKKFHKELLEEFPLLRLDQQGIRNLSQFIKASVAKTPETDRQGPGNKAEGSRP